MCPCRGRGLSLLWRPGYSDAMDPSDSRSRLRLAIAVLVSIPFVLMVFVPFVRDDPPDMVLFFGRLHPVILHLPIGFVVAWTVIEILGIARPELGVRPACRILLWLTVISAIPTAVTGNLLASPGGYDESLLFRHRLLSSLTVVACVWLLALRPMAEIEQGQKRLCAWYHGLMLVNLPLLLAAGHLGGCLTHGSTYLTDYMPAFMRRGPGDDTPGGTDAVQTFHREIAPLLQEICFRCHGADKQKGDFRMDTLDPDMIAGPNLDAWQNALEMLEIEEMPPEGKKTFTPEQREKVLAWMAGSIESAIAANPDP